MRWITHQTVTFALTLYITHNPLLSLVSALGSVLPDSLEFKIYGYPVPIWKHRRILHWPLPYLFLSLISFLKAKAYTFSLPVVFRKGFPNEWQTIVFIVAGWFFAGAVFHILQDALCGTVPLFHPRKRNFGKRLFTVGSFPEHFIFMVSIVAIVWYYRAYFFK